MAATTLTKASEDEILKIFQVVASKAIKSIDSLVKSTQPKLNTLIAETIDAFRSTPKDVEKVMDKLIARMKDLGMSVDDLTKGMDKIPKGMQSLQDALRAKEEKRIEVETRVQELRDAGIAAEVKEGQVSLISKKEMIAKEKEWAETERYIQKENIRLLKDSSKLEKLSVDKRTEKEEKIIGERQALVMIEKDMIQQKKDAKGEVSDNVRGGGTSPDLIDPRGMFAPIVDEFMGIKDSIIGPFQQLGEMGMRVGKSLGNFGKAMLTPIKSLKAFGASLMISLVPMLGWALLIIAIVAIITAIIFKFNDIKDKLIEWWDKMGKVLGEWWQGVKDIGTKIKEWILNIPKMIGEALSDAVEFVGGIGTKIWNALGDALKTAKDFIIDGFFAMINGPIKLLNKVPGINIPLLGQDGASAGGASGDDEDEKHYKEKIGDWMKSKFAGDDDGGKSWFKPWTWGKDDDTAEIMKTQAIAPDGTAKAVIVQDNKTITNNQSNAETAMVAKADKNPEPSSFWDKISFWN